MRYYDGRKFGIEIGKYWLSVLTTFDNNFHESAILELPRPGGLPVSGKFMFISEGDFSKEFELLKSEDDVEKWCQLVEILSTRGRRNKFLVQEGTKSKIDRGK